jgi:hypothetical protein
MSRAPNPPPEDIFKIDLAALKPFLVDLPPGAMRGMRHVQDGWESVVHEITQNQAKFGGRAGISEADFTKFTALNKQYAQIRVQVPLMSKALEILTESLAYVDNLRHRLASTFADAAESHANAEGGDPTLITAYEKTIAYRGIIGVKAFKTRKKNEEAKAASGGATADDKP